MHKYIHIWTSSLLCASHIACIDQNLERGPGGYFLVFREREQDFNLQMLFYRQWLTNPSTVGIISLGALHFPHFTRPSHSWVLKSGKNQKDFAASVNNQRLGAFCLEEWQSTDYFHRMEVTT